MKTLSDHIATVHAQPHHVRKQIVLGVAAIVTAVIALIWFIASYVSGAFAIHGSSFAAATSGANVQVATTSATAAPTGLAGAAGALSSNSSAPAHIEIVDTTPAPQSAQKQSQPTILPF